MKRTIISISLGTLGALSVAVLLAVGSNAAEKRNEIVGQGLKKRPAPVVKQEIKNQSFNRGMVNNSLSLYSRTGQRLEARYTSKGYQLYDLSKGKPARVTDGDYRLQGGGQIKVTQGYITWADKLAKDRSSLVGVAVPLP